MSPDGYKYKTSLFLLSQDIIRSINYQLIDSITSHKDSSFSGVLAKRRDRTSVNNLSDNTLQPIEYYWQNNSFNIYKVTQDGDTNGKQLLKTKNIYHFFKSIDSNFFVFTSDTTYYHILYKEEMITGPHHFPNIAIPYLHGSYILNDHPVEKVYGKYIFPFNALAVGSYNLLIDSTTHRITLDFTSINKSFIKNINFQRRNYVAPVHSTAMYKITLAEKEKREKHILFLFIALAAINSFLAFYKKR